MSKISISKHIIFLLIAVYLSNVFGDNPIIQTCFTADPAPMAYKDRVYAYVGVDSSAAPDNAYLMKYWKCYSSKDMVNWTDHGIVLKTTDFKWSGGEADAAQAIEHNGKFYYYISTPATGGVALGVAVADNPLGPFKDIGSPLVTADKMSGCNATHSWRGLDPTVWIDDNEQAWLYWGNNVLYWVKLNNDLISTTGAISCIAPNNTASFGPDYEEAPWVYKRNNLYYLVYASQFPECIRYATSSTIAGPWTYKGQIMGTQPNGVSNTIHPGVVEFSGKSYFFYHNAGLPKGGSYRRAVCVEQFDYNQDGTIPSIKETSGGVITGVTSLNPFDTIQAETICWSNGVRTEICSEGGIDIDSIHNNDYIKVEGVDFGTGTSSFDARVASNTSGGKIELHLDNLSGMLIGTCEVTSSGGAQTWTTKNCTVTGATGKHDLFLKFTGGNDALFNFNWWKFNQIKVGVSSLIKNNKKTLKIMSKQFKIIDTDIQVSANSNEIVEIKLFNLSGKYIATLYSGLLKGQDKLAVDLARVGSGSYLVNITSGDKKMVGREVFCVVQ
jgi:hypothetical protein